MVCWPGWVRAKWQSQIFWSMVRGAADMAVRQPLRGRDLRAAKRARGRVMTDIHNITRWESGGWESGWGELVRSGLHGLDIMQVAGQGRSEVCFIDWRVA